MVPGRVRSKQETVVYHVKQLSQAREGAVPMTLFLHFQVSTSRREELIQFVQKASTFYEQPGGIRIRLLERLDRPGEFIEAVEYRDRSAYEADQERVNSDPTMMNLLREWRSMHSGPLTAVTYEELIPDSES